MSHVRSPGGYGGTDWTVRCPHARSACRLHPWTARRLSRSQSVIFLGKYVVVPWQHCCSGELYDWQISDPHRRDDAFGLFGLCGSGAAARSAFVTGRGRPKLGRAEFRTPEFRGWSGLAGTSASSAFRRIPFGGSTVGSAAACAACRCTAVPAAGSSAAATARGIRRRSGAATGHASKRTV
jgi:hypothetical protein